MLHSLQAFWIASNWCYSPKCVVQFTGDGNEVKVFSSKSVPDYCSGLFTGNLVCSSLLFPWALFFLLSLVPLFWNIFPIDLPPDFFLWFNLCIIFLFIVCFGMFSLLETWLYLRVWPLWNVFQVKNIVFLCDINNLIFQCLPFSGLFWALTFLQAYKDTFNFSMYTSLCFSLVCSATKTNTDKTEGEKKSRCLSFKTCRCN